MSYFQWYLQNQMEMANAEMKASFQADLNRRLWGQGPPADFQGLKALIGHPSVNQQTGEIDTVSTYDNLFTARYPWESKTGETNMTSPLQRGKVGQMPYWSTAAYKGYDEADPPDDFYTLQHLGLVPGGNQPDDGEAQTYYSDSYGKDPWLFELLQGSTHQAIDIYHKQMRDMQRALTVAQEELAKAQANAAAHAKVAEQRKRALMWLNDTFDFFQKNSDEPHDVAGEVIRYSIEGNLT